jgi:hypothetical protein
LLRLLSALGLAALLFAPASTAKAKKSCAVKGASVIAQTARVVVQAKEGNNTSLYACSLKTRVPHRFAVSGEDDNGSGTTFDEAGMTIVGDRLAIPFGDSSGFDAVGSFPGILVYDAKKGKQVSVYAAPGNPADNVPDPYEDAFVVSVVLGSSGSIAWTTAFNSMPKTYQVERLALGAEQAEILDPASGSVDATSLALSAGGTLYWLSGGAIKTASLAALP